MTEHNLFYYPYASFKNAQLPLLKTAALYFDKLALLDPVGASWDTVGADYDARNAVAMLKEAGLLEIVTPAAVLAKYETSITAAIRRDMGDREFLDLCNAQAQSKSKQRWTLSLAKVPQDLQTDQTMRHLMGDFARDVAQNSGKYLERAGENPDEYTRYAESGQAFNEYREGYGGAVEYRYADFPLALGEAIMMNHALFAGLLYADATPITDDPFHSKALSLKLRRAAQDPAVSQVLERRAHQSKVDLLAIAALKDRDVKLPILNPKIPLAEVLEYRRDHAAELQQARDALALMARRMRAEPWTPQFVNDLEHDTIPDVLEALLEARKARDNWIRSERGRRLLKTSSVAVGAATVALSLIAAPITPIALATAGLGIASGVAIPSAEWLIERWKGKRAIQENGLHYLLGQPA